MSARITTDEQDGWAYVATGSEVHALWVRQRARMQALITESRAHNALDWAFYGARSEAQLRDARLRDAEREIQVSVSGRLGWKTGPRKG